MLRSDDTWWWTSAAIAISVLLACPLFGQAQTIRRPTGRVELEPSSAEIPRLTASDAEPSDQFGWSVAISNHRLAVCSIQADDPDDPDTTSAGEVVIFDRTAGLWSERQIIPNPDPARRDYFGQILAMSDVHLFVGVPADTIEEVNRAGSVYVYTRQGEAFIQSSHLVMDQTREAARFGVSLTIDGENFLVGATRAGESDEGKVFIFARDGDSWTIIQTLIPADWVPDNGFGSFTAISGDWLVVGAPGDPNGTAWGAGAAYVFRRVGEEWVEHQKLQPSDPDWWDGFGSAVAISGGTIMISAGGKDHPSHDDAGAVYVFTETSGNWAQGAQLFAPDPTYGTGWGWSLALSGDTAFIGFPFTPQSELPNEGAVDVLTRTDHVWSYAERLLSPQPASSGSFGYAMALSGSDLLVGAPMEDAPGPVWDAGAAYVISVPYLEKAEQNKQYGWENLQDYEEN